MYHTCEHKEKVLYYTYVTTCTFLVILCNIRAKLQHTNLTLHNESKAGPHLTLHDKTNVP